MDKIVKNLAILFAAIIKFAKFAANKTKWFTKCPSDSKGGMQFRGVGE